MLRDDREQSRAPGYVPSDRLAERTQAQQRHRSVRRGDGPQPPRPLCQRRPELRRSRHPNPPARRSFDPIAHEKEPGPRPLQNLRNRKRPLDASFLARYSIRPVRGHSMSILGRRDLAPTRSSKAGAVSTERLIIEVDGAFQAEIDVDCARQQVIGVDATDVVIECQV